jgi:hypothetical protein
MELRCPKGHVSTDPDYCSECGAKLQGAKSAITAATAIAPEELAAAAGGEPCPVCATPRVVGARFCEVCRYDFQAVAASEVAAPARSPEPPAAEPPAAGPPAAGPPAAEPAQQQAPPVVPGAPNLLPSEPVPQHWDVVITVDPSLYRNPDPAQPCPVQAPERTFPLDMDENLVGRRSEKKDIHPEIMIADPGISRRHLSLRRREDGGFLAIELDSTNGTHLNEAPLEAGIPTPLRDGDQLTLGCWTRLTIRAR